MYKHALIFRKSYLIICVSSKIVKKEVARGLSVIAQWSAVLGLKMTKCIKGLTNASPYVNHNNSYKRFPSLNLMLIFSCCFSRHAMQVNFLLGKCSEVIAYPHILQLNKYFENCYPLINHIHVHIIDVNAMVYWVFRNITFITGQIQCIFNVLISSPLNYIKL